MIKTLDAEERKDALKAISLLHQLGIISTFVFEQLKRKIVISTGE